MLCRKAGKGLPAGVKHGNTALGSPCSGAENFPRLTSALLSVHFLRAAPLFDRIKHGKSTSARPGPSLSPGRPCPHRWAPAHASSSPRKILQAPDFSLVALPTPPSLRARELKLRGPQELCRAHWGILPGTTWQDRFSGGPRR